MDARLRIKSLISKPKKSVVILLIICIGTAGGVYAFQASKKDAGSEKVTKVKVERGDISSKIEASGTAQLETVELSFEVGGILEEIPVVVGDRVKAGDVVARLDAEDFELEVQTAQASCQESQVRLEAAKNDYENSLRAAKEKLEEAETRYKPMQEAPELYTQQEIKLQKAAVDSAKAEYEAAVKDNLGVKSAEIAVQQSRLSLNKASQSSADTVLKSPVEGTVMYIGGEVGERVTAGDDNDTAFAVVCVGDAVSVSAQINELDIPGVEIGQVAEAEFEAIPGKSFPGKVTEIELMPVENTNGIVTYNVSVLLDKPDAAIKDGMTCTLAVIVDEKQDVLLLPKEAVQGSGDRKYVQLASSSDKVERRMVKTGLSDETFVEISQGLKEGEEVMVPVGVSSGTLQQGSGQKPMMIQMGPGGAQGRKVQTGGRGNAAP